jgi:mannose-6-phosphate isomerase-like protein (cupin superfamily)
MKNRLLSWILIIFATIAFFFVPTAFAASLTPDQSISVFHSDRGKTYAVDNYLISFKNFTSALNKDTARSFSAVEIVNPPQYKGFLFEKHAIDTPEDFYVLEGKFEFFGSQPDRTIKVSTGDLVRIPAGVPYGYKNVGSEPGKLLLIANSQKFAKFVEEIGTPIANNSDISANSIQADNIEKIASIAHKYGIDFLN